MRLIKSAYFLEQADEFGDMTHKAYAETNSPELTPEQASDIIGNLKEKVRDLGLGWER